MTPQTPQSDGELEAIYNRCDVSNNRVIDSLSFDEFKIAIMHLISQSQAAAVNTARIDELENLLDAQDQEIDLDGHPLGGAYYIISGDGERYLIEERLRQLRQEQGGEGK